MRVPDRPIVLLIAYYFPPDEVIGAARPFRFYKYLKRLGYEFHVLTAAGAFGATLAEDVEHVPDPLKTNPKQGLAWQFERVSWKFFLRGMNVLGWSQAAYRTGWQFLERCKGRNVVIMSSGPPLGTHLAAWRLAQKLHAPWLADFRDPIDNPGNERAPLERFTAPRLESAVLRNASLVLANTDAMKERWLNKGLGVGTNIRVLWNGFDPEDAIHLEALPEKNLKTWSHVGELYGGRDLRPLLTAVRRLQKKGDLPATGLKIRQVGPAETDCLPEISFLSAAHAQGWFECQNLVPSAEARRLAINSDGLLLIQPQTAVQVPGKLFEYLRLGRPILAYVVRSSPIENILEQAGVPYVCFYPESNPEEIEKALLRFWGFQRAAPYPANAWFEDTFSALNQAEALSQMLHTLKHVVS